MPENLVKRENFIVGAVNKMGRRQVKAKVLCRSVDVQLIKRSSARTLAPAPSIARNKDAGWWISFVQDNYESAYRDVF